MLNDMTGRSVSNLRSYRCRCVLVSVDWDVANVVSFFNLFFRKLLLKQTILEHDTVLSKEYTNVVDFLKKNRRLDFTGQPVPI